MVQHLNIWAFRYFFEFKNDTDKYSLSIEMLFVSNVYAHS